MSFLSLKERKKKVLASEFTFIFFYFLIQVAHLLIRHLISYKTSRLILISFLSHSLYYWDFLAQNIKLNQFSVIDIDEQIHQVLLHYMFFYKQLNSILFFKTHHVINDNTLVIKYKEYFSDFSSILISCVFFLIQFTTKIHQSLTKTLMYFEIQSCRLGQVSMFNSFSALFNTFKRSQTQLFSLIFRSGRVSKN